MNTIMLDRRPHVRLRAWIAAVGLTILMATNCSGGGEKMYPPLPSSDKERPLLPGCKQLRAENGEC